MENQYSIQVQSSQFQYEIEIGSSLVGERIQAGSIVITDERFSAIFKGLTDRVISIKPTEHAKNIDTAKTILTQMVEMKVDRESDLIAVGGGVIQDLSTFVAANYMRGIKWCYFPTSLMAMLDSCIGGKSSLNVSHYKNLIGNFYPPSQVVIDLDFLRTLSPIDIGAGMLEGIKICYARNVDSYLEFKSHLNSLTHGDDSKFRDIIFTSLSAKKWFVEKDEKDIAERRLLNFGHTFGHALESSTDFLIPHGLAVGMGIKAASIFANDFQEQDEILNDLLGEVNEILTRSGFIFDSLSEAFDKRKFETAFSQDKKHNAQNFRMILPRCKNLEVIEFPKNIQILKSASHAMQKSIDSMNK